MSMSRLVGSQSHTGVTLRCPEPTSDRIRHLKGIVMAKLCEGRVAIVTGAGRGIGREHALSLARHGARVVVNDLGGAVDGSGGDLSAAEQVVNEIVEMGGEAVANGDNVADWEGAQRLVNTAIETFGDLHALVNNAGILRDRVLANMTEEEWDAVINVHLKGTFAPSRWAVAYWRERAKAGEPVSGRIVNTTSVSGIYGNPGQSNYGAAKAGIAAFTNIVAMEVARYGVTVNAVGPVALTRMTEGLGPAPETDEEREARAPHWIAPIVTWLCSDEAAGVTGRVFEASGQALSVAEGWVRGPSTAPLDDPTTLGPVVADLLAAARGNSGMDGTTGSWPQTMLDR
jgi:NAD(P)-dependent dehydrogenase (short-subunit alcohol dehydrogenase family)